MADSSDPNVKDPDFQEPPPPNEDMQIALAVATPNGRLDTFMVQSPLNPQQLLNLLNRVTEHVRQECVLQRLKAEQQRIQVVPGMPRGRIQ